MRLQLRVTRDKHNELELDQHIVYTLYIPMKDTESVALRYNTEQYVWKYVYSVCPSLSAYPYCM